MLTFVENYMIILQIFVQLIFSWPVLLYKFVTFVLHIYASRSSPLSYFLLITFLKELCYLPEIRNHSSPKLGYHFHRPFLTTFWPLFPFWKYAPFEITISINFHTRYTNLTEHNKVRMAHDSDNKRNGSHLKYSKYGAFTLWIPESRSRSP
jgi:hypothetical protein